MFHERDDSHEKKLDEVSVLVSCYNKAKDFPRFETNAKDILAAGAEVCIIDDGSTDESNKLLQAFAASSSQVVFVARPNLGSGSTRNQLMQLASRKLIVFLDMDDELSLEVLIEMVHHLEIDKADICVANYLNTAENLYGEMPISSNTVFVTDIIQCSNGIWKSLGYWRYLYRKEFIEDQELRFFPTNRETRGKYFLFDDIFFLSQLATSKGRIVILPKSKTLYKYHAPVFDRDAQERFRKQLQLVPKFACDYIQFIKEQNLSSKPLVFIADYVYFAACNIFIGSYLKSILNLVKFIFLFDEERLKIGGKRKWIGQSLLNSAKLTKRELVFPKNKQN